MAICGICPGERDFVFPLPSSLDDLHAAPLLCAGIIGFRSLRVAELSRATAWSVWLWLFRAFGDGGSTSVGLFDLRFDERRVPSKAGGGARSHWVGSEVEKAARGTRSRRDVRAERGCGRCGTRKFEKGRSGGDQCNSPGPNSRI